MSHRPIDYYNFYADRKNYRIYLNEVGLYYIAQKNYYSLTTPKEWVISDNLSFLSITKAKDYINKSIKSSTLSLATDS